jgi:hypothetical protein
VNRSLRSALVLLSLAFASYTASRAQADEGAAAVTSEPQAPHHPPPVRVSGAVTGEPTTRDRLLIPPYVRDRRGDLTTTALFPLYVERLGKEHAERFVLPYYYRRTKLLDVDVALGLIWSLRGPDRSTFALPPFYTHRSGKDWALGLLPLFATGRSGGHYHTVLPPLLTWLDGEGEKHRWFVGPYYDVKTPRARWQGLFPLYWGKGETTSGDSFQVVPPLFWRFAESDPLSATTVVPPFWFSREKDEQNWALFPLLFHKKSPALRTTTIPLAIFHHARGPNDFRLVTPLVSYIRDDRENRKLWVTPIYQRKRGDRNFDMVAPLFARTWDERDASSGLYVPPFYFHTRDPANRTTVVFPLFVRDYREGISDLRVVPVLGRKKSYERDEQTWWVAPTFHWGWTEDSWMFNMHPLFYLKRSPERNHLAFAPLYFDFKNRKAQTHRLTFFPLYWDFKNFTEKTRRRVAAPLYWEFRNGKTERRSVVGFPIYWDFDLRDRKERYTVAFPFWGRSVVGERTRHFVLNTMAESSTAKDGRWQFHFFPFFARGGSRDSRWWSVLYGLAGYDQRGAHRRAQAFWLPFDLGR